MRCPKCSYLSYEEVERCRNCGYDFALAVPPEAAEAPTLDLPGAPRTWESHRSRSPRAPTDLMASDDEGAAVDLPLFDAPLHADAPGEPVAPPMPISPSSPPLVVRRSVDVTRPARTPGPARPPSRARDAAPPALDFDDPTSPMAPDELPTPAEGAAWVTDDRSFQDEDVGGARVGPRVLAGAVDVALLLGIDALVVWLTLRLLGLDVGDWARLPLAPLYGFLFLLDTSYLVTFTAASGQSLGKMMTGLRVVSEGGGRVPFGHAVVRSVVLLLCAIPAGLGLVPVLLDARGRGLHDRVAGTLVIVSR